MAANQPMSPQQMMASNQSPLQQVRSPPSTLPPTVHSPQPVPSPRQQTTPNPVPSPRTSMNHPAPSPQFAQTHSPHPGMGGQPGTPADYNPMSADQIMLSQLQASQIPPQDPGLGQPTRETNAVTPQDQLSQFVDQL